MHEDNMEQGKNKQKRLLNGGTNNQTETKLIENKISTRDKIYKAFLMKIKNKQTNY